MRPHGIFLLAATALLAAGPAADEAKQEQDRLQGMWKVTAVLQGGRAPAEDVRGWKLVVDGDRMTARDGDKVLDESRYQLDPSQDPPAIEVTYTRGPDKGRSLRGIYRREGRKLTICATEAGKRPKEFASPAGSDVMLFTLEREKSE
jgi:uncharacterized protein (TIGR03067 family)